MEDTGIESVDTGSDVIEDNSYDSDYKDDFSVPTEDDGSEPIEDTTDYSDEDLNNAMMEYIKENYEIPEKFKDIGALINSYKHLESKMGGLKGAPETYEIDEAIFDNYSESVLSGVVEEAHKLGLDNDGLNALLGKASAAQAQETAAKWEMEKHKMGQNADREIADAMQMINANFAPEVAETLQSMVQTADQFYALRDLIQSNIGGVKPATNVNVQPAVTSENINSMLFAKDSAGNLRMETDSAYNRKVMSMMEQLG